MVTPIRSIARRRFLRRSAFTLAVVSTLALSGTITSPYQMNLSTASIASRSFRESRSGDRSYALAEPNQTTRARVSETYGKLPLSFEANQGQTDSEVRFLSRGSSSTLFLTPTEAVLTLRNDER